jgi:hypothetical protein
LSAPYNKTDEINAIDRGECTDVLGCPICSSTVHLIETPDTFNEPFSLREGNSTYRYRCPNTACPFGDTRSYRWLVSLSKAFNNREIIQETCVAKECDDNRVVRLSPFCPKHENEFLR